MKLFETVPKSFILYTYEKEWGNFMLNNENGVTLVGLIVTIIILLILTGTVLAEALGDQGIITMALKATRSI